MDGDFGAKKRQTMKDPCSFCDMLDRLAEFLGNSDGQTKEELEAELIEEMGKEKYEAAMGRFMSFIEEQKEKIREERRPKSEIDYWPTCVNCNGTGRIFNGGLCTQCNGIGKRSPGLPNVRL